MSALEEKLTLLEENRAAEERLINALSHVQLLKEESESNNKLIVSVTESPQNILLRFRFFCPLQEAKNEELDLARDEIQMLKIELMQKNIVEMEATAGRVQREIRE